MLNSLVDLIQGALLICLFWDFYRLKASVKRAGLDLGVVVRQLEAVHAPNVRKAA